MIVGDYDEPLSEFETSEEANNLYQLRGSKFDNGPRKKKRWIIPFILIFLLIAGAGVFWYIGGFSRVAGLFFTQQEQSVKVRLPEALVSNVSNFEALALAVNSELTGETTEDESGYLTYILSIDAAKRLNEIAKANLEEKVESLKEVQRYSYLFDIGYDDTYRDFIMLIDHEQDQYDQALLAASELYMLAAFYQQTKVDLNVYPEVLITIVEAGSRNVLEELVYPADIARVAEIIVIAEAPIEAPATPQAGDKVIVSTGPDNLNLRSGPEITYLIIGILNSGTVLEVIGVEGVWLEVKTPEGREGWVHGGFVDLIDGSPQEQTP